MFGQALGRRLTGVFRDRRWQEAHSQPLFLVFGAFGHLETFVFDNVRERRESLTYVSHLLAALTVRGLLKVGSGGNTRAE